MKKLIHTSLVGCVFALALTSCQKMDRPPLGDYPKDANPPGGPLAFYAAFDGAGANTLMNAVDSIRAAFPADNPLASTTGITGKAIQGANKKFVKYAKPNDWAVNAKSFTIAFWYKSSGAQTLNNKLTNGTEYVMSFPSSNGHWSGSSLLFFLEGNNTACAIKFMVVDKTGSDSWMTWEGGNSIPGIMNNAWHHIALVYNHTTSTTTLYLDGVANPNTRTWGTHGSVNMDDSKIKEMRVGAGPSNSANSDSDDWLASTFKGSIDQLRMYTTAITAADVNALFAGKK